jgi:sulfate adenylyltransferase
VTGVDDTMTAPETRIREATPPRWSPSARELDDAEALLLGAYPGLKGFLGPDDIAAVRAAARLADGTPWPVPVTLEVSPATAQQARHAGSLVLLDEEGTPVGEVTVEQVWDLDGSSVGVAGPVAPLAVLERGSHRHLRRPVAETADRGPVLGVPVDRPPHAPQLAQWRSCARALGARIRLLPLTGSARSGPVDGPALVRICLDAAASIGADVVPVSVPFHGDRDRDRVVAALVAGAYGATHVPGPVVAGNPGWENVLPDVVDLPGVARDLRTGDWSAAGSVPPEFRGPERADDVCATVQGLVARGEPVPEWLTGRSVVRELARARRGSGSGFTVLLTGLSGSGKSTVAKALQAALLERTRRTVTLLDGDLVRSMLSSELTFSRAHRELNVRRIGFVAAEVTRHGGIALCAPIAPYTSSRDEVRAMVSAHGGFLLVHVSTPLAVCEGRDRKGLYAKARAGLLPEFTGVSDPYELPSDADLAVDTSVTAPPEAVEQILELVACRGWLDVRAC